jgi:SNF2 family DNA or RNA helicase
VLKDLPEKSEQILLCDLDGKQRKAYDEIRDHYRASLLGKTADGGLARMKIHVLEALLRLRQTACHHGLVDPARAGEPCAKLETLLPLLEEVIAEGHKALVFSQFTSFLAILRRELDAKGIRYEYLDGQTRRREEVVERFQSAPAGECPLFLISLKAGGFGLNLTAADYVFLLDPWWNPAVETQAIDRTHRIGQTRKVMAYRIIGKGTVEERVLELQASKRALAEAVLGADQTLLEGLTREDLELLLS